ncbi:MAG: hypothetical protein GF364_12980 [Candidatus Lokiarchaeota archaeon]|nr:hypothetical protein [Candidatus Lokiarchaeota archaeon]
MNLYNKDCFDVLKDIEDDSIDAVITDPPYGFLKGHKIETNIDIDKFFKEVKRVIKKNGFVVFFGMQPTLTHWIQKAIDNKLNFKHEFIWYKRLGGSIFTEVSRKYENIEVFINGKRKFEKVRVSYTDLKESLAEYSEKSTVIRHIKKLEQILRDKELLKKCIEYYKNPKDFYNIIRKNNDDCYNQGKNAKNIYRLYKSVQNGVHLQSILSFKPHNLKKFNDKDYNVKHPTVKSLDLMNVLIRLCSKEGDTVLDPFMGSGTTGIVCKSLKRNFIGVEIDKDYFNIALDRIDNFEYKPQMELF